MELDTADHRRSSGVTSGLHRMLTELFTVFQNGGIRLAPQASAPTVAQGAVYFDSVA